ncbi:MAG: hypothetical protein KatS3mg009_2992 [Acidimicrobiia bacterium]|nr:MAG: hypothetical protein KatS3mg009_2992 [Acidimicrobiia bacterium]
MPPGPGVPAGAPIRTERRESRTRGGRRPGGPEPAHPFPAGVPVVADGVPRRVAAPRLAWRPMAADWSSELRSLLRHAPVGIVFLDAGLRFRAVSDVLAAATGRPPDTFAGRHVAQVAPRLWSRLEPTLVEVRDRGATVSRTDSARPLAAGGRARHWQGTYFPTGDGPPFGVGAVIVEVTDHRNLVQVVRFFMAVTDVLARPGDDLHAALERIGRVFVPALADVCAIGLADPGGVVLVHREPEVEAALRASATPLFPTGREAAVLERLAGRPRLVPHVDAATVAAWVGDEARARLWHEHGARSALVAPLVVGPCTLGILTLGFTAASGRRYDQRDLLLAQELAVRLAQLLEHARLTAESDRSRARLEMLAAVGELAGVELDVRARLDRLPALLVPALADVCAVYLAHDDELRMEVFHHPDPAARAAARAAPPETHRLDGGDGPPPVRAVRTGSVVLVDPVAPTRPGADPAPGELRVAGSCAVRSLLCVPLAGDDGPFGALALGFAASGRRYGTEDVALAREVAWRVGAWMSDAIRYERERLTAEVLQHALLPERLPAPVTCDLAVRYLAGASELQVGGDWYDALVLPDGRVVVSIGDVAGHGVSAAAGMGRLRNVIEMCAREGLEPARVLEQLNVAAHGVSPPVMATALVAVVDPVAETLVFASAGHLPPVVRHGDRARVLAARPGPPVGAYLDPGYHQATVPFVPGCSLLLVTDGLVERRDAGIDERLGELAAVFGRAAGDLHAVADRVVRELAGGHAPMDDVALLAVQRPDGGIVWDRRVSADVSRVRALRADLTAWLGAQGVGPEVCADAVLAVNEVVVNGIEHGGTGVYVGARARPDAVVVEVRDGGRWRGTRPATARAERARGRGLMMVEQLSRSAAVETGPRGTTVRFEIAR